MNSRSPIALAAVLILAIVPHLASAQARVIADPIPGQRDPRGVAGAQVKQLPSASPRTPRAAQFDTGGTVPLGVVGDTVTILYFPDGANLARTRHARITSRQRFLRPTTWRAACDDVAHPGWFFGLDAPATSSFAIVLPGKLGMPERREAPPLARLGAHPIFRSWADSVWSRYETRKQPATDRARASLWYSFFGTTQDAGWGRTRIHGLRGPGGHHYGVFSIWMRDDLEGTPNTTTTWIVNAWGWPVMRVDGNMDIYGTYDTNGDGIDEVITSNGLIRWTGDHWAAPTVYVEEPCMLHRVMPAPAGWRP